MKKAMMIGTLTVLTALQSVASPERPGLCLALRGNGFRITSHFGALAQIVENAGLPDAVVGASSGSLSAFLIDSVALNPWINQSSPEDKKLEASLLLKTMPQYLLTIFQEPEFKIATKIAGRAIRGQANKLASAPPKNTEQNEEPSDAEVEEVKSKFDLIATVQKYSFWVKLALSTTTYFKELISPEMFKYMSETNKIEKQSKREKDLNKKAELKNIVAFRTQQVKDALGATSSFNVETDTNLFFRPAALNHVGMIKIWDRLASFYAGYNFYQEDKEKFNSWLKQCAPLSAGKTFEELIQAHPDCGTKFKKLANHYLDQYKTVFGKPALPACSKNPHLKPQECARFRYEDKLSKRTNSFIITSLVAGDAIEKFNGLAAQFSHTTDKNFGAQFKLDFKNFRIGYFGDVPSLLKAKENLSGVVQDSSGRQIDFSQDYKSNVTLPLGDVTWMDALKISTAEPGQSQPKSVVDYQGNNILSFGGWPDPNPVHILKGLNCETSIAVVTTIKSGNKFGEQVMNKIFSNMTGNPITNDEVAFGNNDFTSDWGKWRNKENPRGSEQLSFQSAEGIYCTNWDELNPFDPTKTLAASLLGLANVGYKGSIFIPEDVAGNNPVRSMKIANIQRTDNVFDARYNRPKFNGCIPPIRPR